MPRESIASTYRMPTFSVTAWSWISRPAIVRVSPKGIEAKAASAKKTDTNGASVNISRSARAGMKSSLVSILTASASGWSRPRMRMPKMLARFAPIRSCMIADCLRSTHVSIPPKLSTMNMVKATGIAMSRRSIARPLMLSPWRPVADGPARVADTPIGHAAEARHSGRKRVEDLLGALGGEHRVLEAERFADHGQDQPVGPRLSQGLERGPEPLHASLEVREGAFPLDVGGARQAEVRPGRGVVGVGTLEDHGFHTVERRQHIALGPGRGAQVVVEDPEELELLLARRAQHARRVEAALPRRDAPRCYTNDFGTPAVGILVRADQEIVLVAHDARRHAEVQVLHAQPFGEPPHEEEILVRHLWRGEDADLPGRGALQGRDDLRQGAVPRHVPALRARPVQRLDETALVVDPGEAVAAGVADPPLVDGMFSRGLRRATRRPWL